MILKSVAMMSSTMMVRYSGLPNVFVADERTPLPGLGFAHLLDNFTQRVSETLEGDFEFVLLWYGVLNPVTLEAEYRILCDVPGTLPHLVVWVIYKVSPLEVIVVETEINVY